VRIRESGHHIDLTTPSLQVADPVVSFLMMEHVEASLLHTTAYSVLHIIVNVQIEQAVSFADSTIKLEKDLDLPNPGVAEVVLHVINNDAQFSSLGLVCRILVLDINPTTIISQVE